MASSASRAGERMVHQDYIARIRFSNNLPPPPVPPKLLDIPNAGLAGGQYTAPAFASRLAREQPLNIEADAELGMPLDLVGMPGIFDGDESAIQAPAQTPQIHPHDRALLRPLNSLGKPKTAEASVSFLRRTEYISSVTKKAADPFLRSSSSNVGAHGGRRPEKRRSPSSEPVSGTPASVKRKIEKTFASAAASLKDRNRVRHPTKRNIRLLDTYQMLPDLEAFPDTGSYVTIKFATNPLPKSSSAYDPRLCSAIFHPLPASEAEQQAYYAALSAHEADPARNPKPQQPAYYDFYVADSADTAARFEQKFDVDNPDHDDRGLYTNDNASGPCFQFQRIRGYEAEEKEFEAAAKYNEELIISFVDGGDEDAASRRQPKAVWYYPVAQRTTIRSQRTKNIARTMGLTDAEETIVEQLDLTVADPTEEVLDLMNKYRDDPLGNFNEPPAEPLESAGDEAYGEGGGEGDDDHASPAANGRNGSETAASEPDAEGDEDE